MYFQLTVAFASQLKVGYGNSLVIKIWEYFVIWMIYFILAI